MASIQLASTHEDFRKITQQMGDLMDDMIRRDFCRFRPSQHWHPAVNLYEATDGYVLCVELAGMDRHQIDVHLEDGRIAISGSRAGPSPPGVQGNVRLHMMEIDEGPFYRELDIPSDADQEKISARYVNGYLWVSIPRLCQ